MTQPLALLVYENMLLASQLGHRLPDLGYRVKTVTDVSNLVEQIQAEKPLVMIVDLTSRQIDMNQVIATVRNDPTTNHLPILAIGDHHNVKQQTDARAAGANLVAAEAGFLAQLPQLLEQVLNLD